MAEQPINAHHPWAHGYWHKYQHMSVPPRRRQVTANSCSSKLGLGAEHTALTAGYAPYRILGTPQVAAIQRCNFSRRL